MRFNPCGMVLDYLPCCYETNMRPFSDSDLTVGWRWYPALPGAKHFPFEHFLTSSNWLDFHFETIRLGQTEYDDRRNKYIPPIPEAKGDHFCGEPDYFLNGQPLNLNEPDGPVNQNGIPSCCLDVIGEGIGGEGTVRSLRSPPNLYLGRIGGEGTVRSPVSYSPVILGNIGGEGTVRSPVSYSPVILGNIGGEGCVRAIESELPPIGPDPSDPCTLPPFGTDQWYEYRVGSPNSTGMIWGIPPGEYCLEVRAQFASSASDVIAYAGTSCANAIDNVLASANPGFPDWTFRGEASPPDPFPYYWLKTFTRDVDTQLVIIIEPDDAPDLHIYRARLFAGVCPTP